MMRDRTTSSGDMPLGRGPGREGRSTWDLFTFSRRQRVVRAPTTRPQTLTQSQSQIWFGSQTPGVWSCAPLPSGLVILLTRVVDGVLGDDGVLGVESKIRCSLVGSPVWDPKPLRDLPSLLWRAPRPEVPTRVLVEDR